MPPLCGRTGCVADACGHQSYDRREKMPRRRSSIRPARVSLTGSTAPSPPESRPRRRSSVTGLPRDAWRCDAARPELRHENNQGSRSRQRRLSTSCLIRPVNGRTRSRRQSAATTHPGGVSVGGTLRRTKGPSWPRLSRVGTLSNWCPRGDSNRVPLQHPKASLNVL